MRPTSLSSRSDARTESEGKRELTDPPEIESRSQGEVRAQQQAWDDLASVDALWAILSDPDRQHGSWALGEFFATGETEIAHAMAVSRSLEMPHRRDRALDFGCGVGRLTRALAEHFGTCVGVDIAPEMLARARELNRDVPNCEFVMNASFDLRLFSSDSFDFVYSSKVLQHMSARSVALGYIAEFVRILRQDGLTVFQLPYAISIRRRLQPRRRLYRLLRTSGLSESWLYNTVGLNPMRTISVPQDEVKDAVEKAGGVVVATVPAVEEPNPSVFYYVRSLGRGAH